MLGIWLLHLHYYSAAQRPPPVKYCKCTYCTRHPRFPPRSGRAHMCHGQHTYDGIVVQMLSKHIFTTAAGAR